MPEGYYSTPNSRIPLNDREPGTIADIAWEQLKPFRDVASSWPIVAHGRHHRCRFCGQNLWFEYDEHGKLYEYKYEEILSLIIAHARQNHEEMVLNGDV